MAALEDGGLIRWHDGLPYGQSASQDVQVSLDGSAITTVPAATTPPPRAGWASGKSGIALVSTLDQYGLPHKQTAISMSRPVKLRVNSEPT
jgi:hypothetical protein